MDERTVRRVGSALALLVTVTSVVYAVAYLIITPSAQRGDDIGKAFLSYVDHPAGLRLAAAMLVLSGIGSGLAVMALVARIGMTDNTSLRWASVVAVVGGLATAAHGLQSLVDLDRQAHAFATGTDATRAAAVLAYRSTSATDPRGLATFGLAGLVAVVIGIGLRRDHHALGTVGIALGIDLCVLFVASAVGIGALVLISGGLASLVLNPVWWVGVARVVASEPASRATQAPATATLP